MAAYRFEPAHIISGPSLGRKGWLTIGASCALVVLAVAGYLVLRPSPPTPAGAVRAYFADLGKGDTAAALALVDTDDEDFSTDSAPLLVPAALASVANRPTDATVTSSQTQSTQSDGKVTLVRVTYKVGGHAIEQVLDVLPTGDKKAPFRLDAPFVDLTVQAPDGLNITVNGIVVDADTLVQGTPAFPGAYRATTIGNALFAGATQAAVYRPGDGYVAADIAFGSPDLAPGAQQAVQAAAQQFLDTSCADVSYDYECPMQAPYDDYSQTTTWTITTYPQIQVSAADSGQNEVQFTTGTAGAAKYTNSYLDYNGTAQTSTGTEPINISGYAEIGDDGAIQISRD